MILIALDISFFSSYLITWKTIYVSTKLGIQIETTVQVDDKTLLPMVSNAENKKSQGYLGHIKKEKIPSWYLLQRMRKKLSELNYLSRYCFQCSFMHRPARMHDHVQESLIIYTCYFPVTINFRCLYLSSKAIFMKRVQSLKMLVKLTHMPRCLLWPLL